MIRRHWPAVAIAIAVFAIGLTVRAQSPVASTAPAKPPTVTPEAGTVKELIAREQALEKRYKAFTTNLLALAQKLEKSDRIEDKDKAKALRKAIDLADKEGVDNKFTTLLRTLTKSADIGLNDIASAKNQNDVLIKVLKQILEILQSDDELARIKAEEEFLKALLADLNGIIRGEKILDARANTGKGDPKQLAKYQGKLRGQTGNLADKMGAPKPAGDKNGVSKGDAKKGGMDENQGNKKEDTKDPEGKDRPGGDKNDPKKGDGADSKPSKGGPPSDGKPSKGSPSKGAAGDSKKPMAGDKTAQKPAESRNKEDNKGDQKGAASKSPPGDQQASSKGQGSPSDGTPSGTPKPGSLGSPPSGSPPPPGPDGARRRKRPQGHSG